MNRASVDTKTRALPLAVPMLSLLLSLLLCSWGFWHDRDNFIRGYLSVYLFWLGLTLGAQPLLMIHRLTGGHWGESISPMLQILQQFYPVMLLLLVPLLLNLEAMFPWARPDWDGAQVSYQPAYLNAPFFLARSITYFSIWLGLMVMLCQRPRWQSGPQERLSSPQACVGLALYIVTLSFFAIDWVMSLEPGWFSTLFGFVFLVDHLAGALASALLIALLLPRLGGPDLLEGKRVQQDLGNLLLAVVVLWFYAAMMQYLIIWIADLPSEVSWYIHRNQGGWEYVAAAFALLYFLLPAALLFSQSIKRKRSALIGITATVLVARWIYLYWLVAPSFHPGKFHFNPWQIVIGLAIGNLWLLHWRRHIRIGNYLASPLPNPADPSTSRNKENIAHD